ncbi:MAG: UPF0149 family protein [Burkholderiaceae bacterium]|nr:UPF0149 family protein [Burkholderiaceae bacterium]
MNPTHAITDADLAELDRLLAAVDPDESMAAEELDGFFAGLACSPLPVPPDEYLPMVLGAPLADAQSRLGDREFQRLRKLLDRHRETMSSQLYEGEGIAPVLGYDDDGRASGNAWAIGFVRAMSLRPEAWDALDEDEEHAESLDALMRLVEEVEPPEGEEPEPIGEDEREDAIVAMVEGVQEVYDALAEVRERALAPAEPLRRDGPKVGRNDPCPCGSGRKYKLCCRAT